MPQENNRKALAVCFWGLSLLCMAAIFYFSAQTADDSSLQSGRLLRLFQAIFGSSVTDFIVRKCAHFIEYAALAFCLNGALYFTKNRFLPVWATTVASLYAVSDEIHQLFVEGRACQVRDWAIDTLAAVCSALLFWLLLFLSEKIKKRLTRKK